MAIGNVIQNAMDKLFMDNLTKVNQDNAKQNADILKVSKRELELREFMVENDNAYYMQSLDKFDEMAHEYKLAQTANGKQMAEITSIVKSDNTDANDSVITGMLGHDNATTAVLAVETEEKNALVSIKDDIHKMTKIQEKEYKDTKAEAVKKLTGGNKESKTVVGGKTAKYKSSFDMKMFMGGLMRVLKTLLNPVLWITTIIIQFLPWILIFGALFIGIWKNLGNKLRLKFAAIGAVILGFIATLKGWTWKLIKGIWKFFNSEFGKKALDSAKKAGGWVKDEIKSSAAWWKKRLGFGKKEEVDHALTQKAKMAAIQKESVEGSAMRKEQLLLTHEKAAKDVAVHTAEMGNVAKESALGAQEHAAKMVTNQTKMVQNATEHSTGMLAWAKRMMQDLIIYIKELAKTAYEYILAGLKAVVYYAKIAFQIALSVSAYLLVALAVVAIVLIFAGLFILLFKALGWVVKEVINVVKDIFAAIVDLFGPMVKELINIILTIAMGIAMIVFWPYIIIGLLGKMIFKVLSSVLEGITQTLTALIEGTVGALVKGIQPVFETIGVILHAIFSVFKILIPVWEAIESVIGLVVDLVRAIFKVILIPIKFVFDIVINIVSAIGSVVTGLWNLIKPIWNVVAVILEVVGGVLSVVGEVIADILEPIGDILMPLVSVLRAVLKWILLPIRIVLKIFGAIMRIIGAIFDAFSELIDSVFEPIGEVINTVTTLISAVVKVIGGVLGVLMAPFKWLMSLFGGKTEKKEKKEEPPNNALYVSTEQAKLDVIQTGFNNVLAKLDNIGGGGANNALIMEGFTAVDNNLTEILEKLDNLNTMGKIDLADNAEFNELLDLSSGIKKACSSVARIMKIILLTILSPFTMLLGGLGMGFGLLGKAFTSSNGSVMSSFFEDDGAANEANIEDVWKKFMESVQKNVQAIKEVIVGKDSGTMMSSLFATNKTENHNNNTTHYATLTPTDTPVQQEAVQPNINIDAGQSDSSYGGAIGQLVELLKKIESNTRGTTTPSILGV